MLRDPYWPVHAPRQSTPRQPAETHSAQTAAALTR
jgi:hypothetical protein